MLTSSISFSFYLLRVALILLLINRNFNFNGNKNNFAVYCEIQLSSELIEVLENKSNSESSNTENRIIVAFKTLQTPDEIKFQISQETIQKNNLHTLKSEEYRNILGSLVISQMETENEELEKVLLEIVSLEQIVRRLPIGNVFILENLTLKQAEEISNLNRTVLLSLSRYQLFSVGSAVSAENAKDKKKKSSLFLDFNKCTSKIKKKLSKQPMQFPFNEPIKNIEPWASFTCDPLQKTTCQNSIPWNIARIRAPEVWSRGYKGKGILYGIIDTGVSYKHPALQNNYYGNQADGSFNHNYAWYDGVRSTPKIYDLKSGLENKNLKIDEQIEKIEEEIDRELMIKEAENKSKTRRHPYEKANICGKCDSCDESDSNTNNTNNDKDDNDDNDKLSDLLDDVSDENDFSSFSKINLAGDKCGIAMNEPCDAIGHGTHVASTAIGEFNLGTAPDARWLACRSIASSMGRDEDTLACLNFFLAPHDLKGNNPRTELRPHVIGNSYGWGSWAEVIGAGINLAVQRLESAGTVMVFAVGNTGPDCSTAHSAFEFTVGATTQQQTIAHFSSRGPWSISLAWKKKYSHLNQFNRPVLIKPDISAPGNLIIGAFGSQHVSQMSGTSMAAPHVAGSISLLLQACPSLIGKPKEIQTLLERTSRPMHVPFGVTPCGRDSSNSVPNNFFGAGELDIENAIQNCLPNEVQN